MKFSAFARFSNGFRFSSKPPHGQLIYRQMVSNLGGEKNFNTDFDSLAMARVYANAMAFSRAKYTLERAGSQFRPSHALELLPTLEREYGIAPDADATISDRRSELAVAMRIARGASRVNVESILSQLLGDDFVEYRTIDAADAVVTSEDPEEVGIYQPPGSPRSVFRLLQSVLTLGSPVTVEYEPVVGFATRVQAGDKIAIDSANPGRCEVVTIASADEDEDTETLTLTATFEHPHTSGLLFATGRFPYLMSSRRHNVVVLSESAMSSPRIRRRTDRTLRRLLRGVSTWSLTDGSGPFTVGGGQLGRTLIGSGS